MRTQFENRKRGCHCGIPSIFLVANLYSRTSMACFSLKVNGCSAGRTMSLFPVKAAPAVPAPPPAKAPMAAPLPPPANAPISAPAPAPPPMNPADRLPLPETERATIPVSTDVSLPLMLTELSRTSSSAPPLKWPMLLASTTVPRAAAPLSITVFPCTTTGSATVAENPCPALLSLELSGSPRRTVITVPAGILMVWGTGLLAADLPEAAMICCQRCRSPQHCRQMDWDSQLRMPAWRTCWHSRLQNRARVAPQHTICAKISKCPPRQDTCVCLLNYSR